MKTLSIRDFLKLCAEKTARICIVEPAGYERRGRDGEKAACGSIYITVNSLDAEYPFTYSRTDGEAEDCQIELHGFEVIDEYGDVMTKEEIMQAIHENDDLMKHGSFRVDLE